MCVCVWFIDQTWHSYLALFIPLPPKITAPSSPRVRSIYPSLCSPVPPRALQAACRDPSSDFRLWQRSLEVSKVEFFSTLSWVSFSPSGVWRMKQMVESLPQSCKRTYSLPVVLEFHSRDQAWLCASPLESIILTNLSNSYFKAITKI